MKKGLKIAEGQYLNMAQIVEWWTDRDGILNIVTVSNEDHPMIIVPDSSTPSGRYTNKVPVSELHRIKREINEYMEIAHEERLASVK